MFKRLGNLIRGFFGLFVGGLERQNPEALLEVEKENLREQIGKYNRGLASHAGHAERLMGQIERQDRQERELRARVTAHLRAGNRKVAAQHALKLQSLSAELTENRRQLQAAEQTYQQLTRARDTSIKEAQAKIESLRRGIDDLQVKRATAELNEMAAGMISEIGGAGDTLNRLEQMVEEERTQAAGRSRVARDALPTSDIDLGEHEQQALADLALADFAAAEGLTLDGGASPVSEESASPEAGHADRAMRDSGETDQGKSMGPIAGSE